MARDEDIRIRRKQGGAPPPSESPSDTPSSDRRKQQRKRQSRRRLIVRLIVLVLVVAVGLLIWQNWEVCNPEYVWTWFQLQLTGGNTGDGFPIDIEGNTVVDMQPVGHQLCVLTDGYLLMYNTTAGETVRRPCSFAEPALSVAGKYALIAEIGGKRLRLETLYGTELEVSTEAPIVSATVSDNGTFAVVVESSSYQSEVWVYAADGKKKYHWSSASLLVMQAVVRGDRMAVIGTNVQDGALQSEMLVMDITTERSPKRFGLDDTLFYGVDFFSDGKIAAVGDTGTLLYDGGTDEFTPLTYGDRQLLSYAFSGDRLGLQLGSFGAASNGHLLVYGSDGEKQHTVSFSGTKRWLCSDRDGGFLMLTSDALSRVARDGTVTDKGSFSDGLRVTSFEGHAVVLGLTQMQSVSYGS